MERNGARTRELILWMKIVFGISQTLTSCLKLFFRIVTTSINQEVYFFLSKWCNQGSRVVSALPSFGNSLVVCLGNGLIIFLLFLSDPNPNIVYPCHSLTSLVPQPTYCWKWVGGTKGVKRDFYL